MGASHFDSCSIKRHRLFGASLATSGGESSSNRIRGKQFQIDVDLFYKVVANKFSFAGALFFKRTQPTVRNLSCLFGPTIAAVRSSIPNTGNKTVTCGGLLEEWRLSELWQHQTF